MSTIALSYKAAKLMKLCEFEGFKRLEDLLELSVLDSVCPAICITEGCDYTFYQNSRISKTWIVPSICDRHWMLRKPQKAFGQI